MSTWEKLLEMTKDKIVRNHPEGVVKAIALASGHVITIASDAPCMEYIDKTGERIISTFDDGHRQLHIRWAAVAFMHLDFDVMKELS